MANINEDESKTGRKLTEVKPTSMTKSMMKEESFSKQIN